MTRSRGALCLASALVIAFAIGSAPVAARTSASPAAGASSVVATTLEMPVQYSRVGNNCLHAWLRVEPYGLADRTVHFAIFGVPIGSATTDQYGYAFTCAVFPLSVGAYPGAATAAFAGEGLFAPSSATNDFVVVGQETFVLPVAVGAVYLETVTFRARLTFDLVVGWIPFCVPTMWDSCVIAVTVPIEGRTIFFYRVGALVGSAVTDADGYAVLADVSLNGLNAFQYPTGFTAAFKGDSYFAADTRSNTLFIEPQTTSLLMTPAAGTAGGSTSLSALLRFGGGLPLADRLVVFYLNEMIVGTATTGSNGVARLDGVSLAGLDPGTYSGGVKALFLGELNFRPTAGAATLTIGPAPAASLAANYATAAQRDRSWLARRSATTESEAGALDVPNVVTPAKPQRTSVRPIADVPILATST